MATAVETKPLPPAMPANANSDSRLLMSSVIGAAFILGGVIVAGYGIPQILKNVTLGNSFITAFVRVSLQLAVVAGLAYVGGRLAAGSSSLSPSRLLGFSSSERRS
jgi:hypothetical protein